MELAEGGDLFDKIESDVGVGEDIAHVYFSQLISAVTFMHSKGVGHRDIKPENILLSSEGNLKIADFGLATLFDYQGQRKTCKSSCGSPPYTAPEVLLCSPITAKSGLGYFADYVDIWSCGVVLFVLLVGNTPWDEPKVGSWEYDEYIKTNGHPDDELWAKLPGNTLSLLRGMMKVDATSRFSLHDVRRHPWYTRSNPHLTPDGKLADPVSLATQMFEKIHIDFSQLPTTPTPRASQQHDTMELDSSSRTSQDLRLPSTLPETPTADIMFDWETNPSLAAAVASASQPSANGTVIPSSLDDSLSQDPALSQFAPSSIVPLSLTQAARRFGDVLPAHSLTRFLSLWSVAALLPVLKVALQQVGVPVAEPRNGAYGNGAGGESEEAAWIKVRLVDERKCLLKGDVVVEKVSSGEANGGSCVQVCFVKAKGDPVQWRRFFKKAVLLCGEVVWRPE